MRCITACKKLQEALRSAQDELELGVREFTSELRTANAESLWETAGRKRAGEDLRRSEERFRTEFETAQDCIFVKDVNLKHTYVNPAMLGLPGISSNSIIGTNHSEMFGLEVLKGLGEAGENPDGTFLSSGGMPHFDPTVVRKHDARSGRA